MSAVGSELRIYGLTRGSLGIQTAVATNDFELSSCKFNVTSGCTCNSNAAVECCSAVALAC